MENKDTKASERYMKAHTTFDELKDLLDSSGVEKIQDTVHLTAEEIAQGRANKRDMRKKAKTFANSPIYRTYHQMVRLLMEIIGLMPKKTVKISDIMLQNVAEAIRWSAAAYEQSNPLFKHNSLCEAISLMYTVKVCANSASSINLIGRSKSTQLNSTVESVLRQLVAWRGSIKDAGGYGDE